MSGDFPEQGRHARDRRGPAGWLDACAVPEQRDVPDRCGGPAYAVDFGRLPAHLPPPVPELLIPAPRRAPDDLR
ncbi:hypothetical protein FHX81_5028 [Saccharothrix saharensis]|uniref:Uncharacterized protein n=1 Tax=Saccharothrix saharensis TaxID=571190 RepID=A0A543JIB7_9PSEU|nr:hypothetical protein [Saccharothrix saharensis]TQM82620.1 hypothetical protein FHX81_5028 [Saccharothrix saharensis]